MDEPEISYGTSCITFLINANPNQRKKNLHEYMGRNYVTYSTQCQE